MRLLMLRVACAGRWSTGRQRLTVVLAILATAAPLVITNTALAGRPMLTLRVAPTTVHAGGQVRITVHGNSGICSLRSPLTRSVRRLHRTSTIAIPQAARPRTVTLRVTCGVRSATAKLTITAHIHAGGAATKAAPTIGSTPAPVDQLIGGGRGGGSYPDADAVACFDQYGPSSWCKNNWWISSRGFGYRNCTDFVAWYEGLTWSSFKFPKGFGDAKDWKDYAGKAGLTIASTPTVGDIAWWGPHPGDSLGHVAVVTGVNADGSAAVSEYNRAFDGNPGSRPSVRADAYLHNPANTIPGPTAALQITTSALPAGTVAGAYSTALSATGGSSPYSWTISAGALPDGLVLGPSGSITGTPARPMDANFTVTVRDSSGSTAAARMSISVGLSTHYAYYVGTDNAIHLWYFNGTSWSNQTLGGSVAAGTSPSAAISGGNLYAYYVSSSGQVALWYWNGSSWSNQILGGSVAPNTSPSAFVNGGNLYAFYHSTDGGIHVWHFDGTSWGDTNIGGNAAANTSPAAYVNGGNLYAFYHAADGGVHVWYFNGTSWGDSNLGGSVAANTSPAAYVDGGNLYGYYHSSDGGIHVWYFNGTSWGDNNLGGSVAVNTSPAAYGASGNLYAYYAGTDGGVHLWYWNGTAWSDQDRGGSIAPNTSPTASGATGLLYSYYAGADGSVNLWYWNRSAWSDQDLGGAMAAGTSPSGL